MKLQQLRYISAMRRHGLNVSETADALLTSQPGVSKQIRLLEEELGVEIFRRRGKQMVALTDAGRDIVDLSDEILALGEQIRTVANEHRDPNVGELRIATTHTQARYVLPSVLRRFREHFPRVRLHIHQGTPSQLAALLDAGQVDVAIVAEGEQAFAGAVCLPCYRWDRAVLVPIDHPLHTLNRLDGINIEALAEFPLITYVFAFDTQSQLSAAFSDKGLSPQVVLTAVDADVIKTYVREGMGVGIIAEMAHDPAQDRDLVTLDADHFLPSSVTHICFAPDKHLRAYMYAFIEHFSAHLTRDCIDTAQSLQGDARQDFLADFTLPRY